MIKVKLICTFGSVGMSLIKGKLCCSLEVLVMSCLKCLLALFGINRSRINSVSLLEVLFMSALIRGLLVLAWQVVESVTW